MPPGSHPPGLYLLLISWLDDRACVWGCLCLSVGSSSLLLLPSQEGPTPPGAFPVDSRIDFVLPHSLITAGSVTDLPLRIVLALAPWSIRPRHIYLSCGVPSYIFVLLAAGSLPLFQGVRSVAELWVS